jgi:uncharacterized protein YndB with AHSA1/START domain
MNTTKETMISKGPANKNLFILREFDAPLEHVWKAWTERDLLDQWWAPKPWKTVTKSMDFREGGLWFYTMEGLDGSNIYCRVDYKSIKPQESFSGGDAFCDENGIVTSDMPSMIWNNQFSRTESGSKVEVEIDFASEDDLNRIIEMGFKEGFTAALSNLDELLANGL